MPMPLLSHHLQLGCPDIPKTVAAGREEALPLVCIAGEETRRHGTHCETAEQRTSEGCEEGEAQI